MSKNALLHTRTSQTPASEAKRLPELRCFHNPNCIDADAQGAAYNQRYYSDSEGNPRALHNPPVSPKCGIQPPESQDLDEHPMKDVHNHCRTRDVLVKKGPTLIVTIRLQQCDQECNVRPSAQYIHCTKPGATPVARGIDWEDEMVRLNLANGRAE